jgi:hypothetical protein
MGTKGNPIAGRAIPHPPILSPTGGRHLLLWQFMLGLRQFIRSRRSGAAVAVCVAYALAIQALMASVGVGMWPFATTDEAGFVICSHSPAPTGDPQKPSPIPRCPFCFVAAQTAGHLGLVGEAPMLPAYGWSQIAAISDRIGEEMFIPLFRRTVGDARAPPSFFV